VNFATSKYLTVKSMMFPHHNIHKFTWTSDGKVHNQINHIWIDRREHSNVLQIFVICSTSLRILLGCNFGSQCTVMKKKLKHKHTVWCHWKLYYSSCFSDGNLNHERYTIFKHHTPSFRRHSIEKSNLMWYQHDGYSVHKANVTCSVLNRSLDWSYWTKNLAFSFY
jgi:hypothetical protein